MFVARLISNTTGEITDERVLDMIIERKHIQDLAACLIAPSKKYRPLSFFEAQMHKLRTCGISKKLFLMEGDEEKDPAFFYGAQSQMEKVRRLKRVKTMRMQIHAGLWPGVDLMCTRNKRDTIKFFIQQLESFQKSFNPRRPPTKTMEDLKQHIGEQMSEPTFCEYLRLRSQKGIGTKTAMKTIMDPDLDWDKSFISPACIDRTLKSNGDERATFWPDIPPPVSIPQASSNAAVSSKKDKKTSKKRKGSNAKKESPKQRPTKEPKIDKQQQYAKKSRIAGLLREKRVAPDQRKGATVNSNKGSACAAAMNNNEEGLCGICLKAIDIWEDDGIVLCNRVALCGATFHDACLTANGFDINAHDGCIKCKEKGKFSMKEKQTISETRQANGVETQCRSLDLEEQVAAKNDAGVVVLELESDREEEDDDVIVID